MLHGLVMDVVQSNRCEWLKVQPAVWGLQCNSTETHALSALACAHWTRQTSCDCVCVCGKCETTQNRYVTVRLFNMNSCKPRRPYMRDTSNQQPTPQTDLLYIATFSRIQAVQHGLADKSLARRTKKHRRHASTRPADGSRHAGVCGIMRHRTACDGPRNLY